MEELLTKCVVEPLTVEAADAWDFASWIETYYQNIEEQLFSQGALLIRGLHISTPERLDDFVSTFPLENHVATHSLSYALRINKTERVFTNHDAQPELDLVLQHELAESPNFPDWLFLSCALQPEAGGNTLICRSDYVYQDLLEQNPAFLTKCEDYGLYYRQKFALKTDFHPAHGQSWPHLLQLIDQETELESLNDPNFTQVLKQAAEVALKQKGYRFQWHNNVLEVISPVLPAVRRAKNNGKVFFNQLLAAYTSWNNDLNYAPQCVFFGHGQSIDDSDIEILKDICELHTQDIRWKTGDVVILDNTLIMHGRRAYSGKRHIYASLARDLGHTL